MGKFFKEFKAFALRGNVIDLAVGVIIGAAFQSVVTSLTDYIISPVIGIFTGQNFDELQLTIGQVTFAYGAFITSIINFLITAFIVFLLVRGMNRLSAFGKKEEEKAPTTQKCPYCFSEIPVQATRCPHCTSELPPKT